MSLRRGVCQLTLGEFVYGRNRGTEGMGGGLTGSLACGEGLWQWLGAVAVHLIRDCLACRLGY